MCVTLQFPPPRHPSRPPPRPLRFLPETPFHAVSWPPPRRWQPPREDGRLPCTPPPPHRPPGPWPRAPTPRSPESRADRPAAALPPPPPPAISAHGRRTLLRSPKAPHLHLRGCTEVVVCRTLSAPRPDCPIRPTHVAFVARSITCTFFSPRRYGVRAQNCLPHSPPPAARVLSPTPLPTFVGAHALHRPRLCRRGVACLLPSARVRGGSISTCPASLFVYPAHAFLFATGRCPSRTCLWRGCTLATALPTRTTFYLGLEVISTSTITVTSRASLSTSVPAIR